MIGNAYEVTTEGCLVSVEQAKENGVGVDPIFFNAHEERTQKGDKT